MFGYIILLFTILPALELYVLLRVGAVIGAGNTLMIIVLTGILGAYLARLEGFLIIRKIRDNVNQGKMPSMELLDGLMILVGGIVLLTPGFITDIIGFLLLIPFTRDIIKFWVRKNIERMIKDEQIITFSNFDNRNDDYEDIDIN